MLKYYRTRLEVLLFFIFTCKHLKVLWSTKSFRLCLLFCFPKEEESANSFLHLPCEHFGTRDFSRDCNCSKSDRSRALLFKVMRNVISALGQIFQVYFWYIRNMCSRSFEGKMSSLLCFFLSSGTNLLSLLFFYTFILNVQVLIVNAHEKTVQM